MDVLRTTVFIKLSKNYDIRASVDFEFDEALFTMDLTELVKDEGHDVFYEQSHEQSPLLFKGNNDHFKSV